MTKKIEFFCNLCTKVTLQGDVVGLAKSISAGVESWQTVSPINTDTHICSRCMADVVRIVESVGTLEERQNRAISP